MEAMRLAAEKNHEEPVNEKNNREFKDIRQKDSLVKTNGEIKKTKKSDDRFLGETEPEVIWK